MTPKEKAKDLFDKYDDYPLTYEWKKQCALIAVDEIFKSHTYGLSTELKKYWQEVKQEIEKF
jgi:hypothetical protein